MWVRSIDAYSGTDMLYLNPEGIIPAVAILKKGARSDNLFEGEKHFDEMKFPGAVPHHPKVEEEGMEEEEPLAANK